MTHFSFTKNQAKKILGKCLVSLSLVTVVLFTIQSINVYYERLQIINGEYSSIYAGLSMLFFIVIPALNYIMIKIALVAEKENRNIKLKEIFTLFNINEFIKFWLVNIVTNIYTVLWSFLFIIPGIIAAYSYQMAKYIAIENPDMGTNEIIALSKKYTNGNKFRLFTFEFSWILWSILVGLTFGLGIIYVLPYMTLCYVYIYKDMKSKNELNDDFSRVRPLIREDIKETAEATQ